MGHLTPLWDTLAGPTAKQQARVALNALLSDGNTVFDYQPGGQVSAAGLVVDSWANAIGPAPQLAAAGAARPIWLPFSGEKYGWCPCVNSNFFSSPDSAPASQTGDIALVARCFVPVWKINPDIPRFFLSKRQAINQWSWDSLLDNSAGNGRLSITTTADGFTQIASNATAAPTIPDATWGWVAITVDVDNGAGGNTIRFLQSLTQTANPLLGVWTQIGAPVINPGTTTIFDSTSQIELFTTLNGAQNGVRPFKVSRSQLYSGIPAFLGGTATNSPVLDWNAENWPETATNGATAVSSTTGEVWTLNNAGALPAQIVGSPSALFDGVDDLATAAFALIQPETIYWFGKQVTFTNNDMIFDGGSPAQCTLWQQNPSPTLELYCGVTAAPNANLPLNTYASVCSVFNGANSTLRVNATAATVGNPGALPGNGFTLGGRANASLFSNIQVKEAIGRRVADSAALQAQIITLLNIING